jgi:multiple sugar transport system permease protein
VAAPLLHTVIITAIALPIELVLRGLVAMAQALPSDPPPGRAIFIALLLRNCAGGKSRRSSPVPTWALALQPPFGPINLAFGGSWAGRRILLWTINPNLVYPQLITAEDLGNGHPS